MPVELEVAPIDEGVNATSVRAGRMEVRAANRAMAIAHAGQEPLIGIGSRGEWGHGGSLPESGCGGQDVGGLGLWGLLIGPVPLSILLP